jgi:hypothetical protein
VVNTDRESFYSLDKLQVVKMIFDQACKLFWCRLLINQVAHTVIKKESPEIEIYVHNGDYGVADIIGRNLGFEILGGGRYKLDEREV